MSSNAPGEHTERILKDRIAELEYAVKEQQEINLFCQEEEEKNLARIAELEVTVDHWRVRCAELDAQVVRLDDDAERRSEVNRQLRARIAELEALLRDSRDRMMNDRLDYELLARIDAALDDQRVV